MESYKLLKVIENQKLHLQIALEQVKATNEELEKLLKRTKEMEIQQNDTQYQEESIQELSDEGKSSEYDVGVTSQSCRCTKRLTY